MGAPATLEIRDGLAVILEPMGAGAGQGEPRATPLLADIVPVICAEGRKGGGCR